MPLSWVAIGAGNMELFYVHWNVSMETGLVTVTDEVIKPRSNRNPNQSLNQRLSPAVPSVCNQPGNRFTWNCFVDTGKLRCAAFYKAWWISEKIVIASLTGNLTLRMGSYDFFFFFLCGVQPYEIGFTSIFQRRKLRLREVFFSKNVAIILHNRNSSQFRFLPKHILLTNSIVCAHHSQNGAEINGLVVWHQHPRLRENSKTSHLCFCSHLNLFT